MNIENYIIPSLGDIPIQRLSARHIQQMVNNMYAKNASPRTIKYVMTNLNQIINYAVNNDIILKNPSKSVVLPRQEKFKHEIYSVEEIRNLMKSSLGTKFEEIIMVEVFTGLRRGELLALKWEDVNFEKKTLTVQRNVICEGGVTSFTTPKTESGKRTIVIPDELTDYLEKLKIKRIRQRLRFGNDYYDNNLIICKSDGSPYNPSTFSKDFGIFLEKHGLKHIRFHDLRHSHATILLIEYGTNIKAVSDRLGHSKVQTTMDFYISSTDDAQLEGVCKLENDLRSFANLSG